MEPLLTLVQAAELLAISTRHLRDLCDSGDIRWVDVGRKTRAVRRFKKADLEDFVARRHSSRIEGVPAQLRRARRKSLSGLDYEHIDLEEIREKLRLERVADRERREKERLAEVRRINRRQPTK